MTSVALIRPTFIQNTVFTGWTDYGEAGDFFPDEGIGLMSEGVDVAIPSSDLRDDSVPATSKVKRSLQRSHAGYQAFLTKLYRDMECLLLNKQNLELINNKLKVVQQHSLTTNERIPSTWKVSMIG